MCWTTLPGATKLIWMANRSPRSCPPPPPLKQPERALNAYQQTTVELFKPGFAPPLPLPVMACRVSAGFPSPADDYLESRIDINELLIQNPPATFIGKVSGPSMQGAGIHDGDYIVVNRAAEWADGAIVVARVHDEFTLKRIRKIGSRVFLVPENESFQPIEVTEDSDCEIWGRVTGSFRRY